MRRSIMALGAVAVVALAPLVDPPGYDDLPVHAPSVATYNGRVIDMSRGWQGAQACAVYSRLHAECFDTFEEMEAATGDRDEQLVLAWDGAAAGTSLATDCNGDNSMWLYLYEDVNFGGRVLKFNDVGYWQNLPDYDFNHRLSSWWNTTVCDAKFAKGTNGGGDVLLIPDLSAASSMPSGWNDATSSLKIVG